LDKFERLARTLPARYRPKVNTFIKGLLKAWAVSDDEVTVQLTEAKNQLFVDKAEAAYLDRNASNYGVERTAELGVDDPTFRQLVPILSTYPKQVRATIISLLEVFWGPGFTRANISSGNSEPFNFGAGVLLPSGGTVSFREGEKIVKGTGTSFLTDLSPGEYIRPNTGDDTSFRKISRVISNTEVELSVAWDQDTIALIQGLRAEELTLTFLRDSNPEEKIIRFSPNAFTNLTTITARELADFINSKVEYNDDLQADIFLDPQQGNKLNIRTQTPGLGGAIQITGGTANTPSILNFSGDRADDIRCAVYEVNTNEIVVQIPSTVPVLRRELAGAVHPKQQKAILNSIEGPYNFTALGPNSDLTLDIDGNPYTVVFNHSIDFEDASRVSAAEVARVIDSQLNYLNARTKTTESFTTVGLNTTEGAAQYQITGGTANSLLQFSTDLQTDPDVIITDYPSSYVFDPVGQLFTVTGSNAILTEDIGQGSVQSTISVDNAANIPSASGLLLFNFGRAEQEGPITYNSRPNNSTLLIDASHIFSNNHLQGRYVNLVVDQPTIPKVTGSDYPVYIVGTEEARTAAQSLIRKLIASGVIIRFQIDFPEVLFECTVSVPEDADHSGSLSNGSPLFSC
jgi:hypothetical protein